MFPEKDQNEIYALLEAHYYKPDRVQVVIEELLRSGHWSQGDGDTSSLSHSQSLDVAADTSSAHLQSALHPLPGDLQSDVDHLRDVFPDCDPNYIYERLEANKSSADRVRILAAEMFERRDYPQLKEVIEKQTKQARRQRLQRLDITIEDFLAKFPDPSTTFRDEEKEMKESYKAHVTAQLRHDFPDFKMSYIRSALERHKSHYLHTVQELEAKMDDILVNGGRSKKLRPSPRAEALSYPDEPDEYFFYELWFSRNEQKVKDYFSQKEAARKAKVEAARTNNELYECGCCFEDECLFEEMNACADGHLFCRQCIARSVEAAFGEGKTAFPCLTGSCEHQIPLSVLKDVLPSTMFSKMLRKMQEEEVRQAGIPDLVECPFCSFATIMANPEDRVFRCLNPECLRDSCRLCREPNHVPLKCEEVEKQNETDMRTFIEKRVTEAMLRKCHRCSKRFVKDVGCNKMTCICGATSCYICREPDIDYDHFNEGRCGEGDMNMVHQREMEEAAQKAKEEYLRDHPEAADINLKYDPMQHVNTGTDVGNPFGHDHDDGYDDDEGSIIDSDARDDSYSDSDDPYWGLRNCRPARGPVLTVRHRQARLQWAQGHLNWNNVRWHNVLFSDESRFCIDHADGRLREWRRRGDRYADNCVVENNAWGGPSLMLWGAIGHNQVLGPVIFQGLGPGRGNGITAQRYMDQVLHPHVLPFFQAHGNWVFQHDNARPHTARATQDLLQRSGIQVMPWPALSPGMNPIEQFWDLLQTQLNRVVPRPTTVAELDRAVRQAWANIPRAASNTMVRSMTRRCQAVIDANGGHTRY
nr:hypothetical protein BaRGS_031168 [Batillaria attramentaria]